MGVIESVAARLALESTSSDRRRLTATAGRILDVEAPLSEPGLADRVVDRVVGLGPLQPLLSDPAVTDVLVNAPGEVWVDRGGRLERAEVAFASASDLMATVERCLAGLGLRVDRSMPMADGRLPDGSRIHVAVPPATVEHPVVAIRRFSPSVRTFDQLLAAATVTPGQAELLGSAVAERLNIVVSGGTGSGKTTLLNVLGGEVPPGERVVTIEDSAELDLPGHVVRLEARPPNAEGFGEITIRQLFRSALRLRPDRLVLGEVRGAEALDLLTALNTGHRGSMSTVHANSPEEALWRLETLSLLDGVAAPDAVRRQLFAAVDLIVQMEKGESGRRARAIASVAPDGTVEEIDA